MGLRMARRLLVIGERFNIDYNRRWDEMARGDEDARVRWLRTSRIMGAWCEGPGREKLRSIGLNLDYSPAVDSMNLLPPGRQDVKWDGALARRLVGTLVEVMLGSTYAKYGSSWDYAGVVVCGRNCARAFRRFVDDELQELLPDGIRCERRVNAMPVMRVPHPSGLSRFWNEPTDVLLAREEVNAFLLSTGVKMVIVSGQPEVTEDAS